MYDIDYRNVRFRGPWSGVKPAFSTFIELGPVDPHVRKTILEWAHGPNAQWRKGLTFELCDVDMTEYRTDPLVAKMEALRGHNEWLILRIPPRHWYKVHADMLRYYAANMLLNEENKGSLCWFIGHDDFVSPIEPLHYQKDTMYALSTRVHHAVVNWSDEPRYMLSVGLDPHLANPYFDSLIDISKDFKDG